MPPWCEDWLQVVLASFERDTTLIEGPDRVCLVLEVLFRVVGQRPGLEDLRSIWKVLRLALFFQHPEAAAVAAVLLRLLWPYFTATLEHDRRNSYVTLGAFRIDRVFAMVFTDVLRYCHSWILRSTCMYGHTWQKQCSCGRYIGCSGQSRLMWWRACYVMHFYARCKSWESCRYVMTRDSGMLDTFGHVWACLFSSELLPGGTTDMFV